MALTCVNDGMDWQLSKENVVDRIQALFRTSQWSDCSFRVEGQNDIQVFKAHRLILASSSPVFEAMCFGPLAEKSCINVSDMEPVVFRILLEYIYTDKVQLSSCEEAAGVLYAAKKYMMPHLARTCREYLVTNLRPSNVLSVFDFADEVQENALLEACIKVLCQHASEVLKAPGSHPSPLALRTVLEQNALNIGEAELFEVTLEWAHEERRQMGLDNSPEGVRSTLLKAGLLSRLRMLCMSLQEFNDGPLRSGILSSQEAYALQCALQNLRNKDSIGGKLKVEEKKFYGHSNQSVDVPPGWSGITQPRARISINQFYCVRRFLKTAVTVSGQVRLLANVQADHSVVVSGVRIFTRLVPAAFSCFTTPQKYKENIEVSVLDSQGSVLCRTHFRDVVEYNTLATVTLTEAVRFSAGKEYSFLFVLPTDEEHAFEYPLSFMAQTERTRDIEFRFCDHADIGGTGMFVRRLDMGYVDAVVYSV
ncbi:BTB/POZ domain-containing protein 9 [Gryllus bimaculatus]|nr:BTB/POZ domain-containing protein 9 [Gryllus bimaculatus]